MTKEKFLRKLRESLAGHVSEEELLEVLSDHEEFFQVGKSEGSTEAEVARSLGDPERIALSLIDRGGGPIKVSGHLRVLAFLVDLLVQGLPFLFPAPFFGLKASFLPNLLPLFVGSLWSTIHYSNHWWIQSCRAFWKAGVVLSVLWFLAVNPVLMMFLKGQTVGKRLFGLRVQQDEGGSCSGPQYFVRETVGKVGLNGLLASLWLPLGYLPSLVSLGLSLLTKEGITLWDKIAGTRVVKAFPHDEEG